MEEEREGIKRQGNNLEGNLLHPRISSAWCTIQSQIQGSERGRRVREGPAVKALLGLQRMTGGTQQAGGWEAGTGSVGDGGDSHR